MCLGFSWFQRYYQCFVHQWGKQQQSRWESLGACVLKDTRNSATRICFTEMRVSYSRAQSCQHLGHSWNKYCEWMNESFAVCKRYLFIPPHHCRFEIYSSTVLHMKNHCGKSTQLSATPSTLRCLESHWAPDFRCPWHWLEFGCGRMLPSHFYLQLFLVANHLVTKHFAWNTSSRCLKASKVVLGAGDTA